MGQAWASGLQVVVSSWWFERKGKPTPKPIKNPGPQRLS